MPQHYGELLQFATLALVSLHILKLHFSNCAFNTSGHRIILGSDKALIQASPSNKAEAPGVNALASILLPLAGPEEFDIDVGHQPSLPPSSRLLALNGCSLSSSTMNNRTSTSSHPSSSSFHPPKLVMQTRPSA